MRDTVCAFAKSMSSLSTSGLALMIVSLAFGSWTLWDYQSKHTAMEKAKLTRHQLIHIPPDAPYLSEDGKVAAEAMRSFAGNVILEGRLAEEMLGTWLAICSLPLVVSVVLMVLGGRRERTTASGTGGSGEAKLHSAKY